MFRFRLYCESESASSIEKQVKTLQEACRTAIIRSVTLERMQNVCDIPVPEVLLKQCLLFRMPQDFDMEKIFMMYNFNFPNHVHHMSHRIHPAVCKLDGSRVLIKSNVVNGTCGNCNIFNRDKYQKNISKWIYLYHTNLMNCLFTMYEPTLGLLCYVLQFPLITLQDFAYTVHIHGIHVPEFLVWQTLHKLCSVFEYLRKVDVDADELCQPQHIYLDINGEVKLENMLLYNHLNNPPVVHSNMASFYTPPEDLVGAAKTQDSTQVWGLGCVLYELTKYMPPCIVNDNNVTLVSVDNLIYPMDYGKVKYSRVLQLVITSCLEDNPQNRPSLTQLRQQSLTAMHRLRKIYTGPAHLLTLYPLESTE